MSFDDFKVIFASSTGLGTWLIDMDMATKNRIGKLEDKIFLPIGK